MTRKDALAKMAERKAEAYATGNHSSSFADTYDKRAFEAGFTAAVELLFPVVEVAEKIKGYSSNGKYRDPQGYTQRALADLDAKLTDVRGAE